MDNLHKKYEIVDLFENLLAAYTGAKYAVCVDSCTSALLLSLIYNNDTKITLPNDTYVGVAMAAKHAKKQIIFEDKLWTGMYQIMPTNIYDSAKRFTCDMYIPGSVMCLSFHYKKHLKIGRGGAILTDDVDMYKWLKLARNCGRDTQLPLYEHIYTVCGYNMLLHPDLAQCGIELLKQLPIHNDDLPYEYYGDLQCQMQSILN